MNARLPLHLRSPLVRLGQALLMAGFLPGLFADFTRNLADGPMRSALQVASDVLRLCFFAGVGCILVGWLRNRRARAALAQRQRASTASS
ncbi:MAG TPA: hypothetical protein VFO83_09380 [Aggregicoccus sp.]|nr:hypothetical protein [Aggregicoccus sp.]